MSCNPTIVVNRPQRPLRVTRAPRGKVIVREPLQALTVERPVRDTVVTRQPVTDVTVQRPISKILKVTERGPQGPRGAPGGSIAPIDFSWGDAASVVFTADSPGLLARCRVDITTAFNGTGATIRVGAVASPEAAMPANYNDPSAVAKYQTTPDFQMAAGDALRLDIDPGFSPSTGAGILILEFLPD